MNNLRTKRKIELDGYEFVREGGHYRRDSTSADNPERWLHRYVWHKHKGSIPAGYVVHHKDEDKSNNDISNLELMKFEDHSAHHGKKTDNSHLSEKVWLRLETLEQIDKPEIKVLEAFAGDGFIWDTVRVQTNKTIKVLRIDEKPDKKGIYLKGNNLKFLKNIDLSNFDIIDLDAYGSPFKQLEIVFERKYKGFVHCTFIQSGMGRLDNNFLKSLGYTPKMVEKIPTLFSKQGMNKMERYLHQCGISLINGFFIERKNYFWFKIG